MKEATIRVLVVDDDEEEYTLARRYLNRARPGAFEVGWASSYEQGLSAIQNVTVSRETAPLAIRGYCG